MLSNFFNLTRFASRWWQKSERSFSTQDSRKIAVHPCVINGQPYIICQKGLKAQSPDLFKQLCTYFQNQGYQLKEDRRCEKTRSEPHNERRKLVPIIIFTTSLLLEGNVHAEEDFDKHQEMAHPTHQIELRLIPNNNIKDQIQALTSSSKSIRTTILNSATAKQIFDILMSKYKSNDGDPGHIINDFKQIANYYSDFPEIISLLKSIKNKKWQLEYDEHNWLTTADGNVFEVHNATIHFNTRSAAQLRLNNGCKQNPVCIASPADALLHELLHTQSMLVNTKKFIAQGGMNNMMYPYKHEYSIIDKERKLYSQMSQQDTIKRPYRVDHTGRAIKTSCPTCID